MAIDYISQLFVKFPDKQFYLYILCSIDISLNFTALWNTIKILLFLVHSTTILSISVILHLKTIKNQFLKILKNNTNVNFINSELTWLYNEISIITNIIIKSDNCLISQLFLAAYCSQVPLNVNMISILTFRNLLFNEKIFLFVAACLQINIPFISAQALISMINSYYKLHNYLFKVQFLKFRNNSNFVYINTKLKLMANYEINCTNKKLYYSIGSIGNLSREGFAEVKQTWYS